LPKNKSLPECTLNFFGCSLGWTIFSDDSLKIAGKEELDADCCCFTFWKNPNNLKLNLKIC